MSKKPELRGRAARLARLLPQGPNQAARTPFVLLVVLLLGGGLIMLLVLNSSLNEGSFQVSELKKEIKDFTEEEQQLQRDVDGYAAPDALQRRAEKLGMVPGGDPAFLDPDGTVRGVPGAVAPPAPRPQEAAPPAASVPIPVPPPAPAPAPTTSRQAAPQPVAPRSAAPRPMKPGPPTTSGR
ncbi:septum formation initiator family protein [Streptomyces sp. NPDC003006]